jgi:fucose permease
MTTFVRDRFTWLAYLMLAYFAFMISLLGPLVPFLRAELDLNYSVTALHPSAIASGLILAGLISDRVVQRFGRRALLWGGGAGVALGGVALMLGQQPAVTIAGCFLMGFFGSCIGMVVQASLSDHHGDLRAIPLTESNVAAAVFVALVPGLVGIGEQTGVTWRLAPLAGIAVCGVLALFFHNVSIPESAPCARQAVSKGRARLPRRYWAYWLVVLLSVALEWSVGVWGADFLEKSVGLEKVTAATLMSVFFVAIVIGRVIGSRMTRTVETSRLLIYAIAVVMVGFPLFWLGQTPIINVVGLFVAGLGIANLFPLTLAAATSVDPQQSNTASARLSLASGTAILVAPQILATYADSAGIFNAFGVAAGLLIAAAIIVVAAQRIPVREAASANLTPDPMP